MVNDIGSTNTKDILRMCLQRNNSKEVLNTLQEVFANSASYPEKSRDEDRYLLVIAIVVLQYMKCKRIKTTAQVAHLSECIRYFLQVFDRRYERKQYVLLNRMAEPEEAKRVLNADQAIITKLILLLFDNWVEVKNRSYTYRLMSEIFKLYS